MLKDLANERVIHRRVQELVLCGVRPKTIYMVIGKKMAIAEIKRIHDAISPIHPGQRHGRNLKSENIHKISLRANQVYIDCFELVARSLEQGGEKADALCAVWRIICDRNNVEHHMKLHDTSCEEMIVLFMNMEVAELSIRYCITAECRTPFLSAKERKCMVCACKKPKLFKLAA